MNVVGHADAAHRRRRARHAARRPTRGDVKLPGMLYARVLRSPHPHARIRRIDVSKARALPGVKAVLTHENCTVVWGAGSIAGGQQYNDEVKKITKQRRYAFNNPVRFVGEPVAAVAAVDRHVAEEALQLIAVDYELAAVRRSIRKRRSSRTRRRSGPRATSSLEQPQRGAAASAQKRGNVEAGVRAPPITSSRIATRPSFVHNAQMEPRVVRRARGKATS